MTERCFIKRYGAFFRPGAHGYTGDIGRAGTFPAEVAEGYRDIPGITIHRVSELRDVLAAEIASLEERLGRLRHVHEEIFGMAGY